jgi:dynein heavy chain 1
VLELGITNQTMHATPSIEQAQEDVIADLHAYLGIVCRLPRIRGSRFTITAGPGAGVEPAQDYGALLCQGEGRGGSGELAGLLQHAYTAILVRMGQVRAYVNTWYSYQALWDLDPNKVYARLGDDLATWRRLVVEITESRKCVVLWRPAAELPSTDMHGQRDRGMGDGADQAPDLTWLGARVPTLTRTFDNSGTCAAFGSVTVDYGQVQNKVNVKYDAWHKDIVAQFGARLGAQMADLHGALRKARLELEGQALETASTGDAVQAVTHVQDLKRRTKAWHDQVAFAANAQRLLQRQRYAFPSTWTDAQTLEGEWDAFAAILGKKDAAIQAELTALQAKVAAESKVLDAKVRALVDEWAADKPVQGALPPHAVVETLARFDAKFGALHGDCVRLGRAREALELPPLGDSVLDAPMEELAGLKGLWAELAAVWAGIDDLADTAWAAVCAMPNHWHAYWPCPNIGMPVGHAYWPIGVASGP